MLWKKNEPSEILLEIASLGGCSWIQGPLTTIKGCPRLGLIDHQPYLVANVATTWCRPAWMKIRLSLIWLLPNPKLHPLLQSVQIWQFILTIGHCEYFCKSWRAKLGSLESFQSNLAVHLFGNEWWLVIFIFDRWNRLNFREISLISQVFHEKDEEKYWEQQWGESKRQTILTRSKYVRKKGKFAKEKNFWISLITSVSFSLF